MKVRDATPADFPRLLALNHESVHFLSAMDAPRLALLFAQSSYCRVCEDEAGDVTAFLLAFREGSAYDSENYRWFAGHYDAFLYIDRVVVAVDAQGTGQGAALYADLFDFAKRHGIARVTCEFDVDPPNERSARFHARYGFREVGEREVSYARKRVAMQEAAVGLPSAP